VQAVQAREFSLSSKNAPHHTTILLQSGIKSVEGS